MVARCELLVQFLISEGSSCVLRSYLPIDAEALRESNSHLSSIDRVHMNVLVVPCSISSFPSFIFPSLTAKVRLSGISNRNVKPPREPCARSNDANLLNSAFSIPAASLQPRDSIQYLTHLSITPASSLFLLFPNLLKRLHHKRLQRCLSTLLIIVHNKILNASRSRTLMQLRQDQHVQDKALRRRQRFRSQLMQNSDSIRILKRELEVCFHPP